MTYSSTGNGMAGPGGSAGWSIPGIPMPTGIAVAEVFDTALAPGPVPAAVAKPESASDPEMVAEDTATIVELCRRHMGPGRAALGRLLGVVETESSGAWITASDGRRYLDFGGYGVFILGHRHPGVVAAVRDQLDRHPMGTRVFLEPVGVRAAAALAAVAPPALSNVHFVNSGAEATEAALKLARYHGRTRLVTARNGFHGKTIGALSVTANPMYQDPFKPLLPHVVQVPYGELEPLREALAAVPGQGCLILEPIQGEGGVVVPPPGYLAEAGRLCREYGAMFIVDEIQTGLGRTGSWWASDTEAVEPDIMLVGKGLSGGVIPVAAMLARPEVYEPFGRDPFLHSSTFAASPIACAAALAAVRAIRDEDIVPRAADLGARLLDGVRAVVDAPGAVPAEVRGRGLLIGLEFANPALVGQLVLELLERGVLVNHSLNAGKVLRLTPPAIAGDAELKLFLEAFHEAYTALAEYAGDAQFMRT